MGIHAFAKAVVALAFISAASNAVAVPKIIVGRVSAVPGTWVDVPISYQAGSGVVGFDMRLRVRQSHFPTVDLEDCVIDTTASIRACSRVGDEVRYVVLDFSLEPLASTSIGHIRVYVPPSAANGRYWLPALDFNMTDADANEVQDGQVRNGWIEVTGGYSPTATVGGNGVSSVTMHTSLEGDEYFHVNGKYAVHFDGQPESERALRQSAEFIGARVEKLTGRWMVFDETPGKGARMKDRVPELSQQLRAAMPQQTVHVTPWLERNGDPFLVGESITVLFDEAVADIDEVRSILKRYGLQSGKFERILQASLPNAFMITNAGNNGLDVIAVANQLTAAPEVIVAEPDFVSVVRGGYVPNDPDYPLSTELRPHADGIDYDIESAWDQTMGQGVKVAVLDNGFDFSHADLSWVYYKNFQTDVPPNANDCHGTTVAGFVGAREGNSYGTVGTAPDVDLYLMRIASSETRCSVAWLGTQAMLRDALNTAAALGVQITVNSFFYPESFMTEQAYQNTAAQGLLHFACAGNTSPDPIWFPASLESTVAVASIDRDESLSYFSNSGSAQELVGYGRSVYGLDRVGSEGAYSGEFGHFSGCSFATPAVAGLAALLLAKEPDIPAAEVRRRLRYSAKDLGQGGWDPQFGWGVPNAAILLQEDVFFRDGYEN